MSQLTLTKDCVNFLQKQRYVFDYAGELLRHDQSFTFSRLEEIRDFNLIDLADRTYFLAVLHYHLQDLYYATGAAAYVAFHSYYFCLLDENKFYQEYKQLVSLKLPAHIPHIVSDESYVELVDGMFTLCRHIESFDSSPKLDFKSKQAYFPNDFEIKMAINILGESALDQTPINQKGRCCAV